MKLQVLVVVLGCVLLAGCSDIPSLSPKVIEADGETFVACTGLVWVTSEIFGGAGTFKVTFTDAAGLSHTIRGLKKIEVSDLPPPVEIVSSDGVNYTAGDLCAAPTS